MNNFTEIIRYFLKDAPDNHNGQIIKIDLKEAICNIFDVSVNDICNGKRKMQIVDARRFYLYVLNVILKYGPTKTGNYVGYKHDVVIYHSRVCENLIKTDRYYRNKTNMILQQLKSDQIIKPNLN